MVISRPAKWYKLPLFFAFVILPTLRSYAMQLPPEECRFCGHYILVHKDGFPVDNKYIPIKKKTDFITNYVEPILKGIDQHVKERQTQSKPARILIFVHGGLNPYDVGLERIGKLLKEKDEGEITHRFLGKSSYYPVFINWNSSFGSSVYDDLFEVRRGERNPYLGYATAPFKLAAGIAEGLLTAPLAWWYMARNWVDSFSRRTEEERTLEDKEGYFNSEFINRVYAGVSGFFLFPLRAVTQPFVQTFGTPAWDMMKRRADLAVSRRLLPVNGHTDEGAVWILMDALRERIPRTKDGKLKRGMWQVAGEKGAEDSIEITLVGHSMGTMVIDRILQSFPDIHFSRIIYLASASSIEDFERLVGSYLTEHPDTELWTTSLFQNDEAWENEWYLFFVDRGSLLVWIDSFFEKSVTPRQKRLGRYSNFEEYIYRREHDGRPICILKKELFPKADIRVKKFTGKEDDPKEHGDFDEREILRRIMCMVDKSALDQDLCASTYSYTPLDCPP